MTFLGPTACCDFRACDGPSAAGPREHASTALTPGANRPILARGPSRLQPPQRCHLNAQAGRQDPGGVIIRGHAGARCSLCPTAAGPLPIIVTPDALGGSGSQRRAAQTRIDPQEATQISAREAIFAAPRKPTTTHPGRAMAAVSRRVPVVSSDHIRAPWGPVSLGCGPLDARSCRSFFTSGRPRRAMGHTERARLVRGSCCLWLSCAWQAPSRSP